MDILSLIALDTKLDVEQRKVVRPLESLKRVVLPKSGRSFRDALTRKGSINIIAEIKKASPSKGIFREDFDCGRLAQHYREGGAAAISVLTERKHFLGSFENLEKAKSISQLPVLCKDFILDEYQIYEARAHGADAVLLIAALLSTDRLRKMRETAVSLGMDSLVEIHDTEELKSALASGADIIGVNSRNLKDFSVSLDLVINLGKGIPDGVVRVAESGISSRENIIALTDAGYNAFLIGESLILSDNPAALLRELRGES
ncbi:MAG: indole-3-glycerol phosphate synthase TrpC [Candidatus Zixiibacteriota bacterium]